VYASLGKGMLLSILSFMGLIGSKPTGKAPSGNSLLRMNRESAIGPKGFEIELPRDKVIYWAVRCRGEWELAEAKFIADGLRRAESKRIGKVALFDIGANTGLITLQAMNLAKTKNEIFLFEPIPRHIQAIESNLRYLKDNRRIFINDFALSNRNGLSSIWTESPNHGNSSLLENAVPYIGRIETRIRTVDTFEYFISVSDQFTSCVIKCDTQGMDALILSRIPPEVWEKVESALIEIWALDEIDEKDVRTFCQLISDFGEISWTPDMINMIDLDEVSTFWLAKTKQFRNLFLRRRG